jgi:hypothetical protein
LPTHGIRDLSAKIAAEEDPEKLSALLDELVTLLSLEQDDIRSQIRAQAFGIGKPKAAGK